MAERPSDGEGTPPRSTPPHLQLELQSMRTRLEAGDPLWPAQIAIGLAIALHLTLTDKLVIGPKLLIPAVEGLLLVALVVIAPERAGGIRLRWKHARGLLWTILGLVTLTYLVSLGLLVHYLITGGKTGGHALIGSGVVLWATNVLLFSVIYFDLDRGGPLNRYEQKTAWPDFQFPQMENPQFTPLGKEWRPTFLDYLYTSLTNATAFSPTDTMPITQLAKVLMGIQGTAAIVTVGLVVARAVNILA
jgi:hypothetical protein